jgi:hypothetical protein
MPAFFRAFDSSRDPSLRLEAFKSHVIVPNEELFSNRQFQLDDPHLAWYLQRIAPKVDAMRAIDARLTAELPGIERRFDGAFADMHGAFIGIEPSFENFDGQTHDRLDGSAGLFLGVDGILKYDGPAANVSVLVSHELFHVYQGQVGKTLAPLYATRPTLVKTWTEGLASYVSMRLTPGATRSQALLSPVLAGLDPARTRALACIVRDRSASAAGNDDDLFDTDNAPDGLPPRGGYLIGFEIAAQMAETHSLAELAKLGGSDLSVPFDREIAAMCATGAAGPPSL